MEKATRPNMAGKNTEKRVPSTKKTNQKLVISDIKERERPLSELAELKKELEKFSRNLYKTELELGKANKKLEQYQDKNTKLTQANTTLCGEKADLEKQCQKVSGKCKLLNAEVASLKDQTNKLSSKLKKSREETLQLKSLCKELQEKEIQAKEKACRNAVTQSKKQIEELRGKREYEKIKRQYEEMQKVQSANREMQQDLEKKETQIKLLEKEKASLNVSLSELQKYSIAVHAEIRTNFAYKDLKTKYLDLKEKSTEQQRQLETAQSKISSLNEQISEMKTRMKTMKADVRSWQLNSEEDKTLLKNQIMKLEKEIGQYQTMQSSSEKKFSLLRKRVYSLESLLSRAETELDELKKEKVHLCQNQLDDGKRHVPENQQVCSEAEVSKITALQFRIDELSFEMNRLCMKSEEWRLQCQALQKSDSELKKSLIRCNQKLEKERKNFESLATIYKKSVAMCDDLKVQLWTMTEIIQALDMEKITFVERIVEHEKLLQEKQLELEQMAKQLEEEKKLTTEAEEKTLRTEAEVKKLRTEAEESLKKGKKGSRNTI